LSSPNKNKKKREEEKGRKKKGRKRKGGRKREKKNENSWKRIIFCDPSYPQTTMQDFVIN
jgi:hypothetical protein